MEPAEGMQPAPSSARQAELLPQSFAGLPHQLRNGVTAFILTQSQICKTARGSLSDPEARRLLAEQLQASLKTLVDTVRIAMVYLRRAEVRGPVLLCLQLLQHQLIQPVLHLARVAPGALLTVLAYTHDMHTESTNVLMQRSTLVMEAMQLTQAQAQRLALAAQSFHNSQAELNRRRLHLLERLQVAGPPGPGGSQARHVLEQRLQGCHLAHEGVVVQALRSACSPAVLSPLQMGFFYANSGPSPRLLSLLCTFADQYARYCTSQLLQDAHVAPPRPPRKRKASALTITRQASLASAPGPGSCALTEASNDSSTSTAAVCRALAPRPGCVNLERRPAASFEPAAGPVLQPQPFEQPSCLPEPPWPVPPGRAEGLQLPELGAMSGHSTDDPDDFGSLLALLLDDLPA